MIKLIPPPLHQTLADDVRDRIASGTLAVGASLPSEAELCAAYSVSRGTVRQALATLRSEGLIGGGRGRPPVVLDQPLAQPFGTLLSFSAWAHQLGRTPGQRTVEIARRGAGAEAAAALDLEEGEPVVEVLRLRLLDGAPAMVERTTFVEDVGRRLFSFDPDAGSIYAELRRRGVDLSAARHVIDATAADAVDARLLEVAEGSPLLRERRRTTTATGTPLEWSDDRYRPDVVTFAIENAEARPRPALTRVRA